MAKPLMSRSGRSTPLGGRTEEMRTKVPVSTKEMAARIWHAAGYLSEAEWMADVLMMVVHGTDVVEKLQVRRLRLALGKWKEPGGKEQ